MSEEAIVKNAADPKQVQAAGSKIKLKDALAAEEVKDVMATRNSRRWVWKILDFCNVNGPTFRIDPYQSAYAEGARLAGIEIRRRIKQFVPEVYFLMEREALEDSERGL